ncbi:glutamate-cysteine ligase family protein [Patescibacteria group bacterium AH-259-L05]|nr:glutamate-cysteine ligase family protein [Patescibacteria group bacterium AH-259-L05]
MKKNIFHLVSEVTEWYLGQFPSKQSLNVRKVGLEKEYPVIDAKTYKAADIQKIFPALIQFGWSPILDDVYYDVVTGVKKNGVEITTDGGYCTLEIIMPPEKSILIASEKLQKIEKVVATVCKEWNMYILGYGIQPRTISHPRLWTKKGRYDAIQCALGSKVNQTVITASDQVHIDIAREELIDSINIFNALSGPIIYLFAHSPIWNNTLDRNRRLAIRENIWASFVNKNRFGIPPQPFNGIEEFIWHILKLPLYIAKHENNYIVPNIPFAQWMKRDNNWKDQWKFHEGSIWFNARPKSIFATLEIRPACSQKSGENSSLAALVMGLVQELQHAKTLTETLSWEQWHQLKNDAMYGRNTKTLKKISKEMLKITFKGLVHRGMDEEVLAEPLTQRLYQKTPAQEAIEVFEQEGMTGLVNNVAIPTE